jgi:isocitrate dehydrogenase kinase/phosphatase
MTAAIELNRFGIPVRLIDNYRPITLIPGSFGQVCVCQIYRSWFGTSRIARNKNLTAPDCLVYSTHPSSRCSTSMSRSAQHFIPKSKAILQLGAILSRYTRSLPWSPLSNTSISLTSLAIRLRSSWCDRTRILALLAVKTPSRNLPNI